LAQEVRTQKLAEAQDIAEAVLDAEVRIGELMREVPKAQGTRTDIELCNNADKKFKAEVIKESGFTPMQVSRFETLAAHPEVVEQVKAEARESEEVVTRSAVLGRIKNEQRKEMIQRQVEEIEKGNIEKPDGLFDVIAIDPPWNYGTSFDADGRRVANPYPEMSQEQLKALEIPAKDNCVMFLWTTQKFIWDAKELLDTWGFTYRSMIVWDKEKIGMGDLIRMQCEFCLVGIKGSPVFKDNHSVRDIIRAPRREHSRKPEEFYKIVDSLCAGRKLDFFSREERTGWFSYGNDTKKF
jgi:N6-adenosine-specific RNA methylase IME4